jgi:hypothetical protein
MYYCNLMSIRWSQERDKRKILKWERRIYAGNALTSLKHMKWITLREHHRTVAYVVYTTKGTPAIYSFGTARTQPLHVCQRLLLALQDIATSWVVNIADDDQRSYMMLHEIGFDATDWDAMRLDNDVPALEMSQVLPEKLTWRQIFQSTCWF